MVTLCIVLAVVAGIALGWSARQRQELDEQEEHIEELLVENTTLKNASKINLNAGERVEELLIENATLRSSIQANETCLNLVLAEMGDS